MAISIQNRLSLTACLLEKTDLRTGINGVTSVEAVWQHTSIQLENGVERQIQFDLSAVALGDTAMVLANCTVGAWYKVEGFLNKKSLKSTKMRLHLTHIHAM